MPCEVLEEMKAQLEQHRRHEFQPLILMLTPQPRNKISTQHLTIEIS